MNGRRNTGCYGTERRERTVGGYGRKMTGNHNVSMMLRNSYYFYLPLRCLSPTPRSDTAVILRCLTSQAVSEEDGPELFQAPPGSFPDFPCAFFILVTFP
jgi:hypothetical protein